MHSLGWRISSSANGSWLYSGGGTPEHTAATAAALLAFIEEKGKPAGWATDYTANVENGIAYPAHSGADGVDRRCKRPVIRTQTATKSASSSCPAAKHGRDTYVTGLAIPAIAKYIVVFSKANDLVPSGPLTGRADGSGAAGAWTYKDIVVNAVDYFAFGQNESSGARGGWRYYANYGNSDNSTAQWPVIGMLFATEPGVAAPAFVKDELAYWVEYIQNAVTAAPGYHNPAIVLGSTSPRPAVCWSRWSTPRTTRLARRTT